MPRSPSRLVAAVNRAHDNLARAVHELVLAAIVPEHAFERWDDETLANKLGLGNPQEGNFQDWLAKVEVLLERPADAERTPVDTEDGDPQPPTQRD